MKGSWVIRVASINDMDRWMDFVKAVQNEFHYIDLFNDENYKTAILKNISRSTAIYIQKENSNEIIGAMTYSPNSNHIGWLAVSPNHRRKGIGSALAKYMFDKLPKNIPIKVRTFLETDIPGKTAQSFYKSLGFKPKEILEDINNKNAGNPFHLFIRD